MKKFICFLLDLLYPRHCAVCSKELRTDETHLCRYCLEDLPLTYYWNWRENPAEKLLWGRTYLNFIVSLFFYRHESPYSQLLKQIKYKGKTELAIYLGKILGQKIKEAGLNEGIDYIVPVPLHRKKKRLRGYNQSELIAEGISESIGVEIETGVLIRTRYTKTQTRIDLGCKWENVENAFELKNPERFRGKHLLLVDDVLTTGATTEACWNALCQIQEVRISLATLAFVRSA